MLDETLLFRPIDIERLERARRAAKFCGQATAKIVNLYLSNLDVKAEAWEHEAAVWQRRVHDAASLLPYQLAVAEELESLMHGTYTANLISPSDLMH